MKTKMIIRCALAGAVAVLAAACFSDEDYTTKYESNILVGFEPANYYEWQDFLEQVFGNDRDTVAFHEVISNGPVYHFAALDDLDGFRGGIVLARGRDADASVDRKPSRFAVFDKDGGNGKSDAYAVFHDTTAALMPEHVIKIAIPNDESSCTFTSMYVQNVQAAVQAARTGRGLAGGPFQAGDFLTFSVTGYKGTQTTGTVEFKLIDGTQVVDEWKKLDTTTLGSIDALDFRLTSSRPDFPLYCCVDDMLYHYYEVYR